MEIKHVEEKMNKAIAALENNLTKVRTGRANPNLLDHVEVNYYGCPTPINQIASISVQEGKTLVIKPYDASSLKDIENDVETLHSKAFDPLGLATDLTLDSVGAHKMRSQG